MKIIMIVGKFPVLSETFIIRKAMGLAGQGHSILIMSRRRGDKNLRKPYASHPSIKVEYLIPTDGPFTPWDVWEIIGKFSKYFFFNPLRFIRFYGLCKQNYPDSSERSFVVFFLKFLPFIDKSGYEIVHAEFLNIGVSYRFITEIHGFKYGASCRGADLHLLPLRSTPDRRRTTNFLKHADLIHCVSAEMANSVIDITRSPESVFINRPAVDVNLFMSHARTQPDLPLNILSVGRLEWKKGLDYLMKAYSILSDRGLKFNATIVGGGALHAALRYSIHDLNLRNSVKLLGPLNPEDVMEILSHADIFVLSSVEEGISNSVLEAMASGLPVVSTKCGGMDEVIEPHENGLLVPVRDPFAMADAIAELIQSPELRIKLGSNARKTMEADFTIERQVRVFEEKYKSLLSR